MTETPDPGLDAITEALRSLPLEERVPGYGSAGIPAAGRVELIDRSDDPEPTREYWDWMADDEAYAEADYWYAED
jgi:hypothetical protein